VTGTVAEFDADKGYGAIRADDGTAFFFHCTGIADGSRTIDDGARVTFEVVAGRQGRWEAADVSPDS
jgi:cold shock protein